MTSEDPATRRTATLAALLAITYSVLVVVSFGLLIRAPDPTASSDEFAAFYSSAADRRLIILAALYLMPFAGIAFMWFIVVLRMWISRSAARIDALFSNVQLVSGIVFLAMFFAASATVSVSAVSAEYSETVLDASIARHFTQFGWALLVVFAMRMAAVFIMTTSALGRRHGFLPKWFVVLGYVVGAALLLSASTASFLVLVMPGWLLILGLLLLVRSRSLPDSFDAG